MQGVWLRARRLPPARPAGRPRRRLRRRLFLLPLLLFALLFVPVFFALAGPVPSGKPEVVAMSVGTAVNFDVATCAKLPAPEDRLCNYGQLFNVAGAENEVDPRFLAAIAYVESGYRAEIIDCSLPSEDGALGLMQFLPSTAAERGVNPCDLTSAIFGAAKYLHQAFQEFGTWELAAAAYNAGFDAVRKAGGIPDGEDHETRDYVPKVMAKWAQYKELFKSHFGPCPMAAKGSTTPERQAHVTQSIQIIYDAAIGCFGRSHYVGCYERRETNGHDGPYEHPRGRACDFMMTDGGQAGGEEKVRGEALAEWLAANAHEMNILYVIWFNKVWNTKEPYKPWEQWRTYDGDCVNGGCDDSHAHRNHVHVSVKLMPGDPAWAQCIDGIPCTESY